MTPEICFKIIPASLGRAKESGNGKSEKDWLSVENAKAG